MASTEPSSKILYALLFLASSGASISYSAVWGEAAILAERLPEGRYVSTCLFILFNISNGLALVYCLISLKTKSASPCHLISFLGLSSISSTVLGFFWDKTLKIRETQISLTAWCCILIIFTTASLHSVAAPLFCWRLRASNSITAVLAGEWFGLVIGHVMIIGQKIEKCGKRQQEIVKLNSTALKDYHSETLRFNVNLYMFLTAALTVVGGVAIILATNLKCLSKYYEDNRGENVLILDDDSIRHTTPRKQKKQRETPKLLLLVIISFWSKFVNDGPLSSVLSPASCPYLFFTTKTLIVGTIGSPSACFLAMLLLRLLPPRSKMASFISLPCLGTILLAYFVALAAFSSKSAVDSALFTGSGEILTSVAWATVACLLEYGRGGVFLFCRKISVRYLMLVILASLLGRIMGSYSFLEDFTVCRLYNNNKKAVC